MAERGKRDVVVVQISGGLGNQMFQYAIGRHLARTTQRDLRLDLRPLRNDPLRHYGLNQFNLVAVPAQRYHTRGRRRAGLVGLLDRLRGRPVCRPLRQRHFQFDPSIASEEGSIYLVGHWQSERYFADSAAALRADFSLAAPMCSERQSMLQDIRACNAVSVHVRRGDYASEPKTNAFHGTLSPTWYDRAMARMVERVGADAQFYIFSDDPEWARAAIGTAFPRRLVELRRDGRDAEDLHLMAACRGHIIANSTFGWWGAWLDPRPNKPVIAPARWFAADHVDTSDVTPADWERL